MALESPTATKVAIFGSNGQGREALASVRRRQRPDTNILFVHDAVAWHGARISGVRVAPFQQAVSEGRDITIANGDPQIRKEIALRALDAGLRSSTSDPRTSLPIVHPHAMEDDSQFTCKSDFTNIPIKQMTHQAA